MRQRLFLAIALAPIPGSISSAATVLFDPPTVAFDPAAPNRTYEFDVYLDSEPGGITTFDSSSFVFGSDGVLLLDFQYSPEFVEAAGPPFPYPCDPGPCIFDVYGGFFSASRSLPFRVGTVSAVFDLTDSHWMNDPPEFAIYVDSHLDGGFSSIALGANAPEGLFGGVRLVPEPTSALLIVVGLLALCRRSRKVARDGR